MLHKIVAIVALGSVLGLASISNDAMAAGGRSGVGIQSGSLAGRAGVRGGSLGFRARGFGPGFNGHGFDGRGFGSRDFNRAFGRAPFVSSIWVGNGWLGGPAFNDNDLCFARTSSGYRWACGY